MHANTYKYLSDIFRLKEYKPDGENNRILVEHAQAAQKDNYARIVSTVLSFAEQQPNTRRISDYQTVTQNCASYANSALTKAPPAIYGSDNNFTLAGVNPIILETSVQQPEFSIIQSTQDDLFFCFAAALYFETGRSGVALHNGNTIPFELQREMFSYAAWSAIDDASGETDSFVAARQLLIDDQAKILSSALEELFGEGKQRIAEQSGALETLLQTLRDRTDVGIAATEDATRKAASFESQILDLSKKNDDFGVSIDAKVADADDKIDAFLAAAEARSTYENLKIHWLDRSKGARQAFFWSSILLSVLLIVIPLLAIVNKVAVFAFMKDLSDLAGSDLPADAGPIHLTVATIGRLVVITIPLALYFWLIRLVVRFNSRSLILMDDAALRATMIETYYKMIERSAATPEDRALVLSALMRPAPGHGSDPIDPPNFTEVMDRAMGKGN